MNCLLSKSPVGLACLGSDAVLWVHLGAILISVQPANLGVCTVRVTGLIPLPDAIAYGRGSNFIEYNKRYSAKFLNGIDLLTLFILYRYYVFLCHLVCCDSELNLKKLVLSRLLVFFGHVLVYRTTIQHRKA